MKSGGKPQSNVGKFARPIQSEEQHQIAEANQAAQLAEQDLDLPFDPYKSIENKLRRDQTGEQVGLLPTETLENRPPAIPDSSFKMVSMAEYEEMAKNEVHLPEDIVKDKNYGLTKFDTGDLDLDFKPLAMQK